MSGTPPISLHVDPTAKPVAIHTPTQVPLHWREAVKQGLDPDMALGIIEPVPVNTPVTWCSRMVITAKHDISPHRTVDFQPINRHAPSQTHHTESPWAIAASVPPGTVKTTLDAWHGYHSVPIAKEDMPNTLGTV